MVSYSLVPAHPINGRRGLEREGVNGEREKKEREERKACV